MNINETIAMAELLEKLIRRSDYLDRLQILETINDIAKDLRTQADAVESEFIAEFERRAA
jgi:hypothetical protein